MNEVQKSVLQRHQKEIAADVIMTEEFYGCLYQRKLFERNMIELIRAEKTPTEQVYKMMALLPRRGPDAFDIFTDILKDDYPWLAILLETNYKKANEEIIRQNSFVSLPLCTCGGMLKTEQQTDAVTPRPVAADINIDVDVKALVGTFIHKQFGQSKRISQQDKKSMEKWFAEQIQRERKRLKKLASSSSSTSSEEGCETNDEQNTNTSSIPQILQANIRRTYEKVRDENIGEIINDTEQPDGDCDETDGSEELVDIQEVVNRLEGEVDKLINKLNAADQVIDQCHYILSDSDRKHNLATLVKDLQITQRQYEKEIHKEKEKSEKMLTELYDYCKSINKLEGQRNQQRLQMKAIEEEISRLKHENAVLVERCKGYEAEKMQHLEKEKTLENLRKVVAEMKASQSQLVDENSNYRINFGSNWTPRNYRRPAPRVQSRRGSILEPNANKKNNNKPNITLTNTRRKPPTRN